VNSSIKEPSQVLIKTTPKVIGASKHLSWCQLRAIPIITNRNNKKTWYETEYSNFLDPRKGTKFQWSQDISKNCRR